MKRNDGQDNSTNDPLFVQYALALLDEAVLRIRIHSSLIHVVSVDCEDNNLP